MAVEMSRAWGIGHGKGSEKGGRARLEVGNKIKSNDLSFARLASLARLAITFPCAFCPEWFPYGVLPQGRVLRARIFYELASSGCLD